MTSNLKILLRIVLVLSFLYFLKANFKLADFDIFKGEFYPVYLFLSILTTPFMLIFRGLIWMSLLEIRVGQNLWLFSKIFASMMANVVLPGRAGDLYKVWWSREVTKEKYTRIIFFLVAEKVIEGTTVLLLLLLCFIMKEHNLYVKYAGLILIVTVIVLSLAGIKKDILNKYYRGFGHSILVRAFSFLSFYFFLKSFNIELSAFDVLHINNIAAVGAFIAILPAGMLSFQIAAAYGFSLYGIGESYGVIISSFYQLLLIIITLLAGLVSIALFEKDYWNTLKSIKGQAQRGYRKEVPEDDEGTSFTDRRAAEEGVPEEKGR